MIVSCPSCHTRFRLADDALRPGRTLRCGVCGHDWVELPAMAAEPKMETIAPDAVTASASTVIRPPTPLTPPPGVKPPSNGYANWLISLFLFLLLLAGALYFFRGDLTAQWPGLRPIYESLGFDMRVPGEGLTLLDVEFGFQQQGADRVLTLTGIVMNETDSEKPLPYLRGMLRNDRDEIVKQWLFALDKPAINARAMLNFQTSLVNPPKGTHNVQLDFGPYPDR